VVSSLTGRPTETDRVHSILLVEDNPADVKILQRALARAASEVDLVVVKDGEEAVDYLFRQGAYARPPAAGEAAGPGAGGQPGDRPPWRSPDLILLDLNLPRLTGIDVLKRIRPPDRCLTPVVVLSTSRRPEDVREAYSAGANTYVEKPSDFGRFVDVLRTTLQFWLRTAVPPPRPVPRGEGDGVAG
jgi:CheY-like chemotaxis protein